MVLHRACPQDGPESRMFPHLTDKSIPNFRSPAHAYKNQPMAAGPQMTAGGPEGSQIQHWNCYNKWTNSRLA